MSAHSRLRLVGTTAAVVGVGAAVVGSGIAPAETGRAAPKKITAAGVDGVKLGDLHADLRQKGLVGPIRKGCPLGGPTTRSARLKAPLKGNVNYTSTKPRLVRSIAVRGGARARGVGVGSKIPAIKAAFPKAKVDKDTEQVFGIWLVKIPKNGGGRLQFAVDVDTKRTTVIGIPGVPFCE
jgi:hypothetical protein